ncbi:MAG: ABC transporter ATP-binding protein [Anaerolineae bacterium]|nr:MAG: ABC transporter ATP-binding protein [Anaerolineae bacterium]
MTDQVSDMDLQETLADRRIVGLWRLMRGYRLIFIIATLSIGVAAMARAGTYLLLGKYVDEILVAENAIRLLPLVALAFLGLALIQGGATYFSGRLAGKTAEGIAKRTREYLFDHLQRLPFRYHDKARTGELVQRSTSDVDAIRRFFSEQAIGVGRIVLLFVVNLAVLISLDARLALLSVLVVPITIAMSFYFFRKISNAYEAYQEQEATLSTRLQENLSGVRVVKAFARQEYERSKFDVENWEKFTRGRYVLRLHSVYWPISDILSSFQLLFGLTVGALMVMDGMITIGTYVAYAGMIIWIIWPIRNLGRLVTQMSSGLVSYGRVTEIIKEPEEPLDVGDYVPTEAPAGGLEFAGVEFEYEAGNAVLKDIDLRVQPGQVVALLGPTGSGKSSLVNLLPRFYEYTGGSLKLDGVELNDYPRSYLRGHIGIVEQEPFLFSRTIRENIAYGVQRDVSQDEIEAAARAAAIHDVILGFSEGYDTLVGERGVTLSGGQKQRIAIARTLLADPQILILDDSTSSVDPETEALIRAALESLMQDRTSFVIAHRIQSLMRADLILVLDGGSIVQRGTHEELLEEGGLYEQIHDAQTRIEDELEREIAGV